MKHAYLIMAHNEFDILEKQLQLLDDPRNDFYIHIDRKVKDFPFETFRSIVKYSAVHYIDRLNISWGHFSQVQCELSLLEAAVKGNYRYYHLLSGVDLPLKSNDEIHSFFRENDGKELVQFWPIDEQHILDRVGRFHFMRLKSGKYGWINKLAHLPIRVLHKLGYRRSMRVHKTLAYGGNWFSITHDLAKYTLRQRAWICKQFFLAECSDELFLQTLVENSDFKEKLYVSDKIRDHRANMRCIDWSRSTGKNPWIFRMEDYDMLVSSPCLFARKFSTQVDAQVIEAIYQHVRSKNMQ